MLSTIADIADLIAAAGVIASLLFLSFELRIQNRETQLNNWRELLMSLTGFKAVTNDPFMADLVTRGHADYHALTEVEKFAFGLYLEQGIHIIGNFEKHTGKIPPEFTGLHYPIQNTLLDHLATPGARAWWSESRPRGRFLPATVARIEELQAPGARPVGPHL
ncbi:hypothetical protein HKCCSP123_08120 [Rhodobacterales bacterium HKCCSP123]|nr:hypothetical protein [Rhodobacterales bacterium HKCCSP123]